MALLDLFIAATIPVLKVLLITAIGLFLALDHVDVLGDESRKHFNKVIFFVFSPALVGSTLAQSITYESLTKLWFMPFNIFITFMVGSLLGWIVILLTKPPSHLRGLILGCCAGGNLGNLLLIIIPAVCKEPGSPFGDPDVCQKDGLAYVSLSMAVGAIYLWTYVYNIVRMSSVRSIKETISNDPSIGKSSIEASIVDHESCIEPLLASKEIPVSKDNDEQYTLPCTRHDRQTEVKLSIRQRVRAMLAKINLTTIFAPSTTGAIIGFIIGLVPQIRKLMIGDAAPLRVIQDSAVLMGEGAIPALTLLVGGNLLKGLRGSGVKMSITIGIVLARYVALPIIGVFVVKGAIHLSVVPNDPLYQFVLLIQFAVPPAMNIGTITQLFGTGESECSVIMLWTYALASISLTLWSTYFMWLIA